MRRAIIIVGTAAFIGAAAVAPHAARANPGYELLFREGVLSDLTEGDVISYSVARSGRSAPERAGEVEMTASPLTVSVALQPDDEVALSVSDGTHDQKAGSFPASVGNPLIMYFLETVLRDMANQAGGSPFYIRNRIKDAMLAEADVRPVTLNLGGRSVSGQEIMLHPFASDDARDRMSGFADLALVALVSADVPGWYYSLSAAAPAAPDSDEPGYTNTITLVEGVGQ